MVTRRLEARDTLCYVSAGLDDLAGRAVDELRGLNGRHDVRWRDGCTDLEVSDGKRTARLCVIEVPAGARHVALLCDRVEPIPERLSPRERQVFVLAHRQQLANSEIAARLSISVATVRHHLRNAYAKVGPQTRPRAVPRAFETLTAREAAIAVRAARGETNAEIGMALELSPITVGTHLTRVYRKVRVRNRSGLASKLVGLPSE